MNHLTVRRQRRHGLRVVQAGHRAAHWHINIDMLLLDERQQGAFVVRIASLGQRTKLVDRARKPMTRQPVGVTFHQHHAVTCCVKKPRQLQRF